MVFGLLIAFFIQWTITLGLAELASSFPSAGVSRVILLQSFMKGNIKSTGAVSFRVHPSS